MGGLAFGISLSLLGIAPIAMGVVVPSEDAIFLSGGLLCFTGIRILSSIGKNKIHWKELLPLGLSFFFGVGASFYFLFDFYFRYRGLCLFVSALLWAAAIWGSLKKSESNLLLDIRDGSLLGLLVGSLGFAGFPLLIPFLQIRRQRNYKEAAMESFHLSFFGFLAMFMVLQSSKFALGPLFLDGSWDLGAYFWVIVTSSLLLPSGFWLSGKIVKSLSVKVLYRIQIVFVLGLILTGGVLAKREVPCLIPNPLSCISCLNQKGKNERLKSFSWRSHTVEHDPWVPVEIDGCGNPLKAPVATLRDSNHFHRSIRARDFRFWGIEIDPPKDPKDPKYQKWWEEWQEEVKETKLQKAKENSRLNPKDPINAWWCICEVIPQNSEQLIKAQRAESWTEVLIKWDCPKWMIGNGKTEPHCQYQSHFDFASGGCRSIIQYSGNNFTNCQYGRGQ